jgi:molybdopterin converting factor small subunit
VKVEVQLFATLAAYLPAAAGSDSATLDVPEGSTVDDLVRALAIPLELDCIRVVNGVDADPDQVLSAGDVLSIFPPLAGGS